MLTDEVLSSVMLGAGLLAKKAVEMGLKVAPYIKTSLRCDFFSNLQTILLNCSPGSGVVTYYLEESGVIPFLETLGFSVVGYGNIVQYRYSSYTRAKPYFLLNTYELEGTAA